MKTLKALIGLILFLILHSGPVAAKIAPEADRKTFHTAHFRVHYPLPYENFSLLLAARLEEAFSLLSQDLDWKPESKTEVVVRGDIDSANGFAEVFPYNRLVIHAVSPDPWGFFSESDDWIRTLAIHELTHVIANDETSGLFRVLRSIVGTGAKMNPYQPSWLIEGLAVYEETRFTQGGRGRSVWTDMILRTAVRERLFDQKITLDRMNDGVLYWPMGHTPYLFGYLVVQAIADARGTAVPFQLSKENSAHLPFWIESVAQDTLGHGYPKVWEDTLEALKRSAEKDLAKIREEKVTEETLLTSTGRKTRGYAPIQGGGIYIRDSQREGVGLTRIIDGQSKNLSYWRWDGGTRLKGVGDGEAVVYSRTVPYLEHHLFSDLFIYDVNREKETRLTEGFRGFDPEPSSDFQWDPKDSRIKSGKLFFVKNLENGNQALASFDGETEALLYEGKNFERISTPSLGKGVFKNWILFSEKSRNAGEKLCALSLETKKRMELTSPTSVREATLTANWEEDGSILYSSGEGGVFNIYRMDAESVRKKLSGLSGAAVRLTNSLGGLLQPQLEPGSKQILAIANGPDGMNIARIALEPQVRPYRFAGPGLMPLIEKLSNTANSMERKTPASAAPDFEVEHSEQSYSVFPAFWPKYWSPDLRRVSDGWTLGVQTSNFDPWEAHRYRLYAGADTRASFPLWSVNYQYDGLFPTFEFSMLQENRYFATYQESNRIQTNELKAYVPAGWESFIVLGGSATTSRLFGQSESTGGFHLGWSVRKMKAYDDSIDSDGESGVSAFTELAGYFGGKERFSSVYGQIEVRIPSPISRHFFRVAANYAHSNNNRIEGLYFLGGGEETISASHEFLLRGYEPGTVFGREILTSNFEYHLPVADVFRGFGTFPAYFERTRMKVFVDAASAEYVGTDQRNLSRWPLGAGVHFLNDFNLLYRVPVTFAFGFDRGFSHELGGESRFVLGLFSRFK
jgi:hypothetical protein